MWDRLEVNPPLSGGSKRQLPDAPQSYGAVEVTSSPPGQPGGGFRGFLPAGEVDPSAGKAGVAPDAEGQPARTASAHRYW